MDLAPRPVLDDLPDVELPRPSLLPWAGVATRPAVDPGVARAAGAPVAPPVTPASAAVVTPAALRLTAVPAAPAVRWSGAEAPVPPASAVVPEAAIGLAPRSVPEDPPARDLRRLRGADLASVLAPQRSVAEHYGAHVLGLAPAHVAGVVDRALDRVVRAHRGWRRLRRRPTPFGTQLRNAIRAEAWRLQRTPSLRRT